MTRRTSLADPPVDVGGHDSPPSTGDTELRYLVLAAQREGARAMSAQLRPLGLTPAQAEILLVLSRKAPLTLAELGRQVVCESGSPSRLVDTLTKAGLVEREPGRIDRRVIYLRLSTRGEEMIPQLREVDTAMDRMVGSGLSEEHREIVIMALRRVIDGTPSAATIAERFPREDFTGGK
ncbi:DNA-binding transcriptional regulator, MarR family [Streptomyces zhaozhouensis]|uniref:DNA-binding transcriptional regulator, MarR family n=1 Tax=Streptomyces zhaozhouensis TaxID=1300267 RepID=A0A286DNZ8_9ACTN|nr:MarR family transcriptional regulator [Streptomyces zhaozhouensis]SOD60437.1 DNA-binding transcriptional regulator, MarR family [Streptomyces zhaozhouensis]